MMEVFQFLLKSPQEQRCLSPSENEEKQTKTNALMHKRTEKSAFTKTCFDAYKGASIMAAKILLALCECPLHLSISLSLFFSPIVESHYPSLTVF